MKAVARGFRVKNVKSSNGKKGQKITTEHKLYLVDTWKSQGHVFGHSFYQEIINSCLAEMFEHPKYMNTAMEFFQEIKQNFKPEVRDYHLMVLCCARAKQFDTGMQLYQEFLKQGYETDQQMYGGLMRLCALTDNKAPAEKFYKEMITKGLCPPFYTFEQWYAAIKNL